MNLRVPGYTRFLDDGNRVELDAKEYVVKVSDVDGYSIRNLLSDLANKTKWGICQEPAI